MKRIARLLFVVSFACVAAHPAAAKRVKPSVAPAEVMTALKKLYPKAKVRHCLRKERDGKTVFEIETRDGKVLRGLVLSEAGEVLEKKERIALKELPAAVKLSAQTKYPQADIVSAKRVTKGAAVVYELELRMGSEKESIVVDGSGEEQLLRP
ncbi:MAG: hypothetical protein WC969_01275 [Elusimicrobiota bacterium]|jgi:hypothetical protein